ncbi:hypothetical protein [Rhodococcus sp. NPDC058521]|uniref:hypothetical protein n=1 Tax=Rhodococcus sp. NPDC058521 TaxID=3346536 RepID=UPI00365F4F8B
MSTSQTVVITGASSGFGNLTGRALAQAGHTVYAGMRQTTSRNASRAHPGRLVVGLRDHVVEVRERRDSTHGTEVSSPDHPHIPACDQHVDAQ